MASLCSWGCGQQRYDVGAEAVPFFSGRRDILLGDFSLEPCVIARLRLSMDVKLLCVSAYYRVVLLCFFNTLWCHVFGLCFHDVLRLER